MDELIKQDGGPFRPGDRILLLGPPGVGKAMTGMQLLCYRDPGEEGASVLLSFSRHHGEPEGSRAPNVSFRDLHCLSYDSSESCIDEVIGALHDRLTALEMKNGTTGITRLFVDDISELRRRFDSEREFENFLISFLSLLKTFPSLVSMVSVQTRMFASYAKLEIPAANHFSVVVGLSFQEHRNTLMRGLVVLRALARPHSDELKLASVDSGGVFKVDPLGGFAMVGLSGDPAPVHEEKPFLKLFFQNASEHDVIERAFNEFKKRYPKDQTFVMVPTKNLTRTTGVS